MADKIKEGELAARLTADISGGLGNHKAGKVFRDLSISTYNTLVHGGVAEQLKPGSDVPAEPASTTQAAQTTTKK